MIISIYDNQLKGLFKRQEYGVSFYRGWKTVQVLGSLRSGRIDQEQITDLINYGVNYKDIICCK